MKKIKLAKLPDRIPVKMTVTLPSELVARLRSYADLYAEQYGTREEPTELVPYILDAFLRTDMRALADDDQRYRLIATSHSN